MLQHDIIIVIIAMMIITIIYNNNWNHTSTQQCVFKKTYQSLTFSDSFQSFFDVPIVRKRTFWWWRLITCMWIDGSVFLRKLLRITGLVFLFVVMCVLMAFTQLVIFFRLTFEQWWFVVGGQYILNIHTLKWHSVLTIWRSSHLEILYRIFVFPFCHIGINMANGATKQKICGVNLFLLLSLNITFNAYCILVDEYWFITEIYYWNLKKNLEVFGSDDRLLIVELVR